MSDSLRDQTDDPATSTPATAAAPADAPAAPDAEASADDAPPPEPERAPAVDVPYDVAYRLAVYWDIDKAQYGVRSDELGNLQVWADTRAQALALGEAALESRIGQFAVRGEEMPRPFDLERAQDFSGQLELHLSRGLHRDLAQQARRERCSVEQLAGELLARGLGERRSDGRPGAAAPRGGGERRDFRRDERGDRDRNRRGMSADRYTQVMEDKASFMEYVRGLDQPGGPNSRGGRGRRGR
jgi:hypothetical protein